MSRKELTENNNIKVKRGVSGLGIFAVNQLKKGDELLEYLGPHVDLKTADTLKNRYLFTINDNEFINGAVRTNKARYFNHSCKPNAEAIQNGKRIFIVARKKILPGEEITFDYGTEYFDEYLGSGCLCVHCKEKRIIKEKATA